MQNNFFPTARTADMVVRTLGSETLLYDHRRRRAFCLNHAASIVWRHCDGATSVEGLVDLLRSELKMTVDESVVLFALEALERDQLLERASADAKPAQVHSRRELIQKLGKTATIAVPVITAIAAAPPAAFAQYSGGGGCVLGDTPVLLADGSFVPAHAVKLGDVIAGTNVHTGSSAPGPVQQAVIKAAPGFHSIVTESGELLQCSPSHLVIAGFGDEEGTRVDQLRVGDLLLSWDQTKNKAFATPIVSLGFTPLPQPVYHFSLSTPEHTFISGGLISHNFASKQ